MFQKTAIRRVGASLLIATVLLLGLSVAPTMARTVYLAELTGDAVAPGPGDPNAFGVADIRVFPGDGEICWDLLVDDLSDPATGAFLHQGDVDVVGPLVVTLGTPDADGATNACSSGHDSVALQAIVDDPENHYVSVVTAAFPNGAVRGQLSVVEVSSLTIAMLACPEGVGGPEDVDPETLEPCAIVHDGPIEPLPAGYTYDPEPIAFGWNAAVTTVDGSTFDIGDASLEGGGSCDTLTLTCRDFRWYDFGELLSGETSVTQLSMPPGYEFGWATVSSGGVDDPQPALLGTEGMTVLFDTGGTDDVRVNLFQVPAGSDPTPSPTNGPRPTPPATSTTAPQRSPDPSPSMAVAAAVAGLLALAAVHRARRLRPPA